MIRGGALLGAGTLLPRWSQAEPQLERSPEPLDLFGYDQVRVDGALQTAQRENVQGVLLGLDTDSVLHPFRAMSGLPAPGTSLGGWYGWNPTYNFHHDDAGLAPGSTYGQWISALARLYAGSRFGGSSGSGALAERVVQWNALLADSIRPGYFAQTRFAAYTLDKLVCGLTDAYTLAGDSAAFRTLDRIADAAEPVLPGHAVDREVQWKPGADISWMWDESYTLPENLFRASQQGAGPRYRRLAEAYLDDATYFAPLARGEDAMSDRHAYSYVNALCSAMQAYLVAGSQMHLQAAVNGFDRLERQSFATGGWGPEEVLRKPGYDEISKSLTGTHNSFETPCGSFAHSKLTSYLLRATRDGRYGDSMERMLHNTVLGALPLTADGRSFYYADYNVVAKRIYSVHRWPCCSGTLPQVAADYGIHNYFRSPGAVWVNLYQASALRWQEAGVAVMLEQAGDYPVEGLIRLHVTAARPVAFALQLRIPAWAGSGATLQVNGRPLPVTPQLGFAGVSRTWRTGDVLELRLPLDLRLEQLAANGGPAHPETVALLRGPLVLMVLREPGETGPLAIHPTALLSAERVGPERWLAHTSTGTRELVPFSAVGERAYTVYTVAT